MFDLKKWMDCKRLGLLMACFALWSCQSTNAVSSHQKKDFITLVFTLPRNSDIFTDEAFKKAGAYLPVIFSLTEKDLEKYDIYPFDVIIGGVCSRDEYRDYAIRHFSEIRHPELKLFLAVVLFDKGPTSPEIESFLHDALRDEEQAEKIAGMIGPNFQDFKTRLKVSRSQPDK